MEKVLTVSIAAYNIEEYIDTCLAQFADLKFCESLEVLLIDDGSTDRTKEIAMRYADQYPMIIKYIYKDNGGWGSTVNRGIFEASGKYFKHLDGDDYFCHDNLLRYIEFLRNADADLVFTDYAKYKDGETEPFERTHYNQYLKNGCKYDLNETADSKLTPTQMHSLTIKTSLLKENYDLFRITENCFYADVEYWIKAIYLANTFSYYDTVIYMYRLGLSGQSVSKAGMVRHYKEHLAVLKKCVKFTEENVINTRKKELVRIRLTWMTAYQYRFYLCLPISRKNKHELMEFNKWVKNEALDIVPRGSKRYEILNKTAFILYPIVAAVMQMSTE